MARINEFNAVGHAERLCGFLGVAAILDDPGIQRMVLDDQQRIRRGMCGERREYPVNRLPDAIERRMDLNLGVRIQLQRKQVIGQLLCQQALGKPLRLDLVRALLKQAPGQPHVFAVAIVGAVAFVMRKATGVQGISHAVADVVEGPFVEVVTGGLASGAGRRHGAMLAIPGRVTRQA